MYENYTLIAYGCGKSFYSYLERLDKLVDIPFFCDRNKKKIGENLYGDKRICISPEEIKNINNPFIIITIDEIDSICELERNLTESGIPYRHARDIINLGGQKLEIYAPQWLELIQRNKIHRFIDLNLVGTTSCNFRCEYCYVWRRLGFQGENKLSNHSVEELCKGLSVEKTGGVCFINMCARGETLLAEGIVAFIEGLLEEGHFVSIVTNATITKRVNEILQIPEILLQRLFFKISFHYKELKRLSLLDTFWDNVLKIKHSKCSFTLEITPGDGSEQYIEEMEEICRKKMDGALPHVSFTRDSKKKGYDLLSDHSVEKYKAIWGQFNSQMFSLKSKWYGKNMKAYTCYAGAWSYLVNTMTGDIKACYQKEPIGNIFDQEMKTFPIKTVGKECCISYCFNNHAFLAWGCIPEIECESYLDMRERVSDNGEHWVKEPVYSFMKQKLGENNFIYANKWPDYEKLYKSSRQKAFILFNSPDYPNLGDHAIALAEKEFFGKYFSNYEFIEISCSQYIKENLRIRSAIRKDDILVITGGGNMGDNYLRLQDIIFHIIQNYQDNIIIIAPQSMYFEGDTFSNIEIARMKSLYEKHSRLMLTAREERTYGLYQALFDKQLRKYLIPDMAFFLKKCYATVSKRKGALICLRTDKESLRMVKKKKIEQALEKLNLDATEFTTISSSEVLLHNRKNKVFEALNIIAGSEVVVTDRLHCMIFCVITNTPCVVFDNTTGKIAETLKWLAMCKNVVQCQKSEEIGEDVKKVMLADSNCKDSMNLLYQKFELFAESIEEFIK